MSNAIKFCFQFSHLKFFFSNSAYRSRKQTTKCYITIWALSQVHVFRFYWQRKLQHNTPSPISEATMHMSRLLNVASLNSTLSADINYSVEEMVGELMQEEVYGWCKSLAKLTRINGFIASRSGRLIADVSTEYFRTRKILIRFSSSPENIRSKALLI